MQKKQSEKTCNPFYLEFPDGWIGGENQILLTCLALDLFDAEDGKTQRRMESEEG